MSDPSTGAARATHPETTSSSAASPWLRPQQAAGVGALLVGLGVALGAFGAHSLTDLVTPARLETFQTGVRYQIYSGLGLMLLGVFGFLGRGAPRASLTVLAGTVVFCGSLYLLVAGAPGFFGAVAPVGGALMIGGWALAAWRLWRA